MTYTADTDRVLNHAIFSGGSQNLSVNPGGYDPAGLGNTLDGEVTELIAFADSAAPGQQIQLNYEMRAGDQIFYDSRGGGWCQLFFQLTPSVDAQDA